MSSKKTVWTLIVIALGAFPSGALAQGPQAIRSPRRPATAELSTVLDSPPRRSLNLRVGSGITMLSAFAGNFHFIPELALDAPTSDRFALAPTLTIGRFSDQDSVYSATGSAVTEVQYHVALGLEGTYFLTGGVSEGGLFGRARLESGYKVGSRRSRDGQFREAGASDGSMFLARIGLGYQFFVGDRFNVGVGAGAIGYWGDSTINYPSDNVASAFDRKMDTDLQPWILLDIGYQF